MFASFVCYNLKQSPTAWYRTSKEIKCNIKSVPVLSGMLQVSKRIIFRIDFVNTKIKLVNEVTLTITGNCCLQLILSFEILQENLCHQQFAKFCKIH